MAGLSEFADPIKVKSARGRVDATERANGASTAGALIFAATAAGRYRVCSLKNLKISGMLCVITVP